MIRTTELYPGTDIYEPMKVWSLPKHKKHMLKEVCENGEYFAQVKKDGNWFSYHKGVNGENYFFGRGNSVKTGFPVEVSDKVAHLLPAFEQLPNDTIIIGELYIPNKNTNAVRSILGCLTPKAIKRQQEGDMLHFYMFDIIRLGGEDKTKIGAYSRYVLLRNAYDNGLIRGENVEIAEEITGNLYDAYGEALANGEEGIVLKKKTAPYSEGKKPAWSMIKAKKEETADVVCMGFADPTKEYTGKELSTWEYWIDRFFKRVKKSTGDITDCEPVTKPFFYGWKNSITYGVYDKKGVLVPIGSVSSGLNDDLKKSMTENPEKYLNRVIECQYMEITDDGIMRHPIFLRFRDDKSPEECTKMSLM